MSNQTKTGEKAKHTVGPLYVVDVTSREPGKADRRHFDVFAQTGPYLHTATCEKEADAVLYAAAPDLLEVCKASLRLYGLGEMVGYATSGSERETHRHKAESIIADINAQVAKAEGQVPS